MKLSFKYKLLNLFFAKNKIPKPYCIKPFVELRVDENHQIKPCAYYKGSLGKLTKKTDLSKVIYGKKMKTLRKRMFENKPGEGCKDCPFKEGKIF